MSSHVINLQNSILAKRVFAILATFALIFSMISPYIMVASAATINDKDITSHMATGDTATVKIPTTIKLDTTQLGETVKYLGMGTLKDKNGNTIASLPKFQEGSNIFLMVSGGKVDQVLDKVGGTLTRHNFLKEVNPNKVGSASATANFYEVKHNQGMKSVTGLFLLDDVIHYAQADFTKQDGTYTVTPNIKDVPKDNDKDNDQPKPSLNNGELYVTSSLKVGNKVQIFNRDNKPLNSRLDWMFVGDGEVYVDGKLIGYANKYKSLDPTQKLPEQTVLTINGGSINEWVTKFGGDPSEVLASLPDATTNGYGATKDGRSHWHVHPMPVEANKAQFGRFLLEDIIKLSGARLAQAENGRYTVESRPKDATKPEAPKYNSQMDAYKGKFDRKPVGAYEKTKIVDGKVEIPSDYTLSLKSTNATKVELFGVNKSTLAYKTNLNAYGDVIGAVADNYVTAIPLEGNKGANFGAIYRNVGVYQNQPVDVKMTVVDYENWVTKTNPYRPHVYINTKQMGVNVGGANVEFKYEFFNAITGERIRPKGVFSLADIDAQQGVEIYDVSNIEQLYMTSTSPLYYDKTGNGLAIFHGGGDSDGIDGTNPDYIATFTFESDEIRLKYYQDTFNPETYHPAYRYIDGTKDPKGTTRDSGGQGIESGASIYGDKMGYSDINIGASYFEVSANKPLRTQIPPPVKFILDKDSYVNFADLYYPNGKPKHKNKRLKEFDDVFAYQVSHTVPAEYKEFVYHSYVFKDVLDKALTITTEAKDIKVLDESGADKTHYFDIVVNGNTVTAKAKESVVRNGDLGVETFYNHAYHYAFNVKVNDKTVTNDYVQKIDGEDYYVIENIASVIVDNKELKTDKVIVEAPVPNDDIDIIKTVNNVREYNMLAVDETVTYNLRVPLPKVASDSDLVVTDVLIDELEFVNSDAIKSIVTNDAKAELAIVKPQVNGKSLTVTLDKETLAKHLSKEDNKTYLDITFEATLTKDAQSNSKKLAYNNEGNVTWNGFSRKSRVTIIPPKVVKSVNDKKHVDLNSVNEIFTYTIKTNVPTNADTFTVKDELNEVLEVVNEKGEQEKTQVFSSLEGTQAVVTNNNGKFTVTLTMNKEQIAKHSGQDLVIKVPTKIKDGAMKNGLIPNTASIEINGKPTVSNEVTVLPPSFTKTVNGKENVDLLKVDEVFTFEIDTLIPTKNKDEKTKSVKITDELLTVFEVKGLSVYELDKDATTTDSKRKLNDLTPSQDGNVVKLNLDTEQAEKYQGKTIRLEIKAKIKDGADLSTYTTQEAVNVLGNGTMNIGVTTLPNKAKLQVDNRPVVETEKVTVTPPKVEKTINDVEHYDLIKRDEIVTYQVKTVVPKGITEFEITDELVPELEVKEVVFNVNGIKPTVVGNKVSVKANAEQIKSFEGTLVVLEIKAQIKEGAILSAYANERVPNVAKVFNDKVEIITNEVTLTPPLYAKTVNGKSHANLTNKEEVFTYEIKTNIPKGKSTFDLSDELVKELEVVSKQAKVNLKSVYDNGVMVDAPKAVIKGNNVSLHLNEAQLSAFGGEQLVITFDAKIRKDADITTYKDSLVPNTGVITIDGQPNETNTVTVTPQVAVKTVDGGNHSELTNEEQTFVYDIVVGIPTDVTTFVLTDKLVDELEIVDTKKVVTNFEGVNAKVDGQTVSVTMNETQLALYGGKDLKVTFEVGIKHGADLTKYKDGKIPNKASYKFDNNPIIETNTVTVALPTLVKTINDTDFVRLKEENEQFTYKLETTVPTGSTKFKLTDVLEDDIKFVDGAKVDVNLRGFEAKTEGQNLTVEFTENDLTELVGQKLIVTFKAELKNDYDLSKYKAHKAPNKATVVTDLGKMVSNTVYVTYNDIKPTKTVNDTNEIVLVNPRDEFTYKVTSLVPSDAKEFVLTDKLVKELEIVGEPKINLEGVKATVSGNNVVVKLGEKLVKQHGDKTLEMTIKAKVRKDADLTVHKDNKVPNKAVVNIDGHELETDTVYVVPNIPVKTVDGKKHKDLEKFDQIFTYDVKVIVPKDAKDFVLTDKLVNELEFVKNGKVDINIDGLKADIKGQTITVKMNEEQLKANEGKELILTFEAAIKHGADLSKYKDGKVPNKAQYKIDNNPVVETNVATISLPTVVKTINDTDFVRLAKDNEEFTYKLETTIPSGLTEFKLVDVLEKDIRFADAKAIDVNLRGFEASVDKQTLKVEFTEGDLTQFADDKLIVTFKAKFASDFDLSKYKQRKVPNFATLEMDNGKLISNTVYVTTGHEKPVKTVNDVKDVTLSNQNEVFEYKIAVQVPNDAEKFVLNDELVKELEIVGDVVTNLEGVKAVVDGNKVSVTLGDALIEEHADKKLELVIKAQIRKDADISIYDNAKVPNKAVVNIDGHDYETDTVYVTTIVPTKTVNGKKEIGLAHIKETFDYEIIVEVPKDAKEFIVTDKIVEELEVIGSPTVNLDGVKVKVDGQTVSVALTEKQLKEYAEKTLKVKFKSGVRVGADISKYADNKVPNVATIKIDDEKEIKTNEVFVKIPQIEKFINDKKEDVTLTEADETFVYTVKTIVPNNDNEVVKDFVVTDKLVGELQFEKAELNFRDKDKDVKFDEKTNTVTVTFNEKEVETYKNQELELKITAKFKDNANVTKYENGKVPNTASYKVNKDEPQHSNTVYVIPSNVKPQISKTINGQQELVLDDAKDKFIYEITTTLPKKASIVTVTDTLENDLEIIGEPKTNLEGISAIVSKQQVSATLTKADVEKYGGKELVITFEAKLIDGYNLDKYSDKKVPNIAILQVEDNTPIPSEKVTVTVSDKPVVENGITKTVNGVKDLTLKTKDENFKYEVTAKIPTKAETFIVADELDSGLTFVTTDEKVEVKEADKATDKKEADKATDKVVKEKGTDTKVITDVKATDVVATAKNVKATVNIEGAEIKVDGQRIMVKLNAKDIEKHGGKDLVLAFEAKLAKNVDLKSYPNGKVPNTALYQVDDKPVVKSNEVLVGVPTEEKPKEPIKPTPNNPTPTPSNPTPNNPTQPTPTPSNPTQPTQTIQTLDKPTSLPQTGEEEGNNTVLFVGLALLAITGIIAYAIYRKRAVTTEEQE